MIAALLKIVVFACLGACSGGFWGGMVEAYLHHPARAIAGFIIWPAAFALAFFVGNAIPDEEPRRRTGLHLVARH